jgi:hypothetical protein
VSPRYRAGMASSPSAISDDVQLPEDTRMRIRVRRGAAAAMVSLTLSSVAFFLTGPAIAFVQVDDAAALYQILGVVLSLVTAPLLVLAGLGLRAYPHNRKNAALVWLPAAAALLTIVNRIVPGGMPAPRVVGLIPAAAAIALLLAADRILCDGAGDPTAPRSKIARVAIAMVALRALLWFGTSVVGYTPISGMSIVTVVVVLITFWKVRKLLL